MTGAPGAVARIHAAVKLGWAIKLAALERDYCAGVVLQECRHSLQFLPPFKPQCHLQLLYLPHNTQACRIPDSTATASTVEEPQALWEVMCCCSASRPKLPSLLRWHALLLPKRGLAAAREEGMKG